MGKAKRQIGLDSRVLKGMSGNEGAKDGMCHKELRTTARTCAHTHPLGLCLPDSRRRLEACLLEEALWQVPKLGPSAEWIAGLNSKRE